jgi:hypothetical protein
MRPIDFLDSKMLRVAARAGAATRVSSHAEPGARLEDTTLAHVLPVRVATAAFIAERLPWAHRSST